MVSPFALSSRSCSRACTPSRHRAAASLAWATILLLVLGAGFSTAPATAQIETSRQALLGDVNQAGDCTAEQKDFNQEILFYGRTAAVTDAYAQCIQQEVSSRYKKCEGDPFYDASQNRQIDRVMRVSLSTNDVKINCSGGSGNASTGIGSYAHPDEEEFWWGGWFGAVHRSLGWPVCGTSEAAGRDDCRFAAYPWPYTQAAGIVWHEVMHTHGYTHGANDQAPAKRACGYEDASNAEWHFQRNTMPYIVGECVSNVLSRSGDHCNLQRCSGDNELQIITSYDGTACRCVRDPGQKGLGILSMKDRELVDDGIHPTGDRIGGWLYAASNRIAGTGDFNGDGRSDFILTSGWGIGIATFDGSRWRRLVAKPNGTRFGGWNYQTKDNTIEGIGDFNGDGRDDIVIRSGWGLGILTLNGSTLNTLMIKPKDTWFGEWRWDASVNRGRDTVEGVADLTGDGRADLLVSSSWGLGVLTLRGNTLTSVVAKKNGTRFGGWNYQSADNDIVAVGPIDGDRRADVVIRSGWGMGVLEVRRSTLRSLDMKPHGQLFGSWLSEKGDRVVSVDDLAPGSRSEILIQSPK